MPEVALAATRKRTERGSIQRYEVTRILVFILSHGVTLPYYRFYRQNTLLPILSIARSIKQTEVPDQVSKRLQHWRERKLNEFQFVQVASTLLAAAVIGCFSWTPKQGEHWIGPAAWYCSLILSFSAVLLSSSAAFIFSTIKHSPHQPTLEQQLAMIARLSRPYWDEETSVTSRPETREDSSSRPGSSKQPRALPPVQVDIRWNMVFTWQAPMMLLAYSVLGFLVGLITYVATPLYSSSQFDGESKAAVLFLVWAGVTGAVFVWCSFWAYKFVDLEGESL